MEMPRPSQNKSHLNTSLLVLIVLGFAFFVYAGEKPNAAHGPSSLNVTELIVRPGDGKSELRCGALDELYGGVGIRVRDHAGTTRLYAGVVPGNDSQPVIHFLDSKGRHRLAIELGLDGDGVITANSAEGKLQFGLVGRDGGTGFELFENGEIRLRIFADCCEGESTTVDGNTSTRPADSSKSRACIRIYDRDQRSYREIP